MKPDPHVLKEKKWLAVQRRCDELLPYARRYIFNSDTLNQHILWEPLEKPVFAGWDISVGLSDERMRSIDAPDILAILDILGISKPCFYKEKWYIQDLRKNNYDYIRVSRRKYHWSSWDGKVEKIFNRTISEKQFNSLNPHLKTFFDRYLNAASHWKPEYYTYVLNHRFPDYELRFKVKKSYNKFIGHLYGDKIGEYKKLHDWLWDDAQGSEKARVNGGDGLYRWDAHYQVKSAWRNDLRRLKVAKNDKFASISGFCPVCNPEDEYDGVEEYIFHNDSIEMEEICLIESNKIHNKSVKMR